MALVVIAVDVGSPLKGAHDTCDFVFRFLIPCRADALLAAETIDESA
jgi:hypothetical protein